MDLQARVTEAVAPHIERVDPPGLAWWVARGDEVAVGAQGTYGPEDATPVRPDTPFRISSVTKPVVAASAMSLLDDGTLTLDAPVERWLPELGDRRVLRDPAGPLDDTVPAARPITVADVLELRLGIGLDFSGPFPGPVLSALGAAGLQAGPPAPQTNPAPDDWMLTVGAVPLSYQPGERWLYHSGSEVLGVLVARAAGAPLPEVLAERVLAPLAMTGTGFGVRPEQADRLGPHWLPPDGGALMPYDPAEGQWSRPPAFPNGGDGLVSTVEDLAAFGRMLRAGGVAEDGTRVLSREVLAEATRPRVGQIDADGLADWGLGFGVKTGDQPDGRSAGSYGWDGGMGSTLWVDPVKDVVAVLLTNQMWSSPEPTAVFEAFWRAAWE
ncbi:beta-lactamase family protein [Mumia sp. ZJ1417]|uniref:serine hydrolase domain-containing protein n=1 Tax=Mumia sp. ZJ1417 TaxID=2708082 RepID=UPI0014219C64|nr:serine hydrolase domain-containing protein [Mumia sp. ZJ1417]QMW66462.1 beta-lactamase family protein [Mumia sp. ZJ1417]